MFAWLNTQWSIRRLLDRKILFKNVFRIVNRCIATRQPRTIFYSWHPFFPTNNCLSSPFSIHQLQSLVPFISFSPPHSINESQAEDIVPSEPLFSILKRRHGKMLPSKMGLVALKSTEGTIEKGSLRLNLNSAGSLCSVLQPLHLCILIYVCSVYQVR